jgi:hypothetical protein
VLRAKNGSLPLGLSGAVEVLVERSRAGRPDNEIRGLLLQLVPDFKVSATAAESVLDALPN